MTTRTVTRREHVRTNPVTGEKIPVRQSTAAVDAKQPPRPAGAKFAPFSSTGTAADPFAPAEPVDRPAEQWEDDARQWAARALACKKALREGHGPAWRNRTNGMLFSARARICAAGGTAPFPGLFNENGERANARLLKTKFGSVWMVFADDDPRHRGTAIAQLESGSDELKKAGFAERDENVRAWARMIVPVAADGTPQPQSAKVEVFRMDKGIPSMN